MVEEKRSLPYLHCGEIIPSNLDQSPILTLLFISYSVDSRVPKVQCDWEVWASILMTYLLCLLGGVVPCLEVKLLSQHNLMSWEQDAKTLPFPSPHGQSDRVYYDRIMARCVVVYWFITVIIDLKPLEIKAAFLGTNFCEARVESKN